MPTANERITNADRYVGEVIYLLPLFGAALLLSMLYPFLVIFIAFPLSKPAYSVPREDWLHFPRKICRPLSCATLLIGGLVCVGIEAAGPWLQGQPMLPFFVAAGMGLAWAYASDAQGKQRRDTEARDGIIAAQRIHIGELESRASDLVAFNPATASESEIRARGLACGAKDEDIDFIVRCLRTKTTRKEFAAEMNVSESTVKNKKRELLRALTGPPPALNI